MDGPSVYPQDQQQHQWGNAAQQQVQLEAALDFSVELEIADHVGHLWRDALEQRLLVRENLPSILCDLPEYLVRCWARGGVERRASARLTSSSESAAVTDRRIGVSSTGG